MNKKPFIFEGDGENFSKLVLENSHKGPVLVHYWAPWAGPCMMLKPLLYRLVEEYSGKFILVEIDTDQQKQFSTDQEIRSLPMLRLYRNGNMVEEFHGGQAEAEFRRVLDKYTGADMHPLHASAVRAYQNGGIENALSDFARAIKEQPDNPRIAGDYARVLFSLKQYRDAEKVITSVHDFPAHPTLMTLLVHARFAIASSEAASVTELRALIEENTGDCLARLRLASLMLINDEYEQAMRQLIEIMKCDPDYMDGIGRQGLLVIFSMLDDTSELVSKYRSKMAALGE
ncbi:MAG: hypothetical protein BMS9Abin26_0635 [Gammaproteobacteria bacterium]|nr:MAG: hypothetical protein BMS9Abin26_0635 [Gammaproteobacteria bacterium]